MAVKINKMGPELHAAYVRNKRNLENEAAAGGSSAGNTQAVKKIPLQKDAVPGSQEGGAENPKDPRVHRGDTPKFAQTFAEVHYDPADVESDEAEEEEFNRAEAERIQINLPDEAYAVPYANVAHIILPILLAGDPDGSGYGSEDDIIITIDAKEEQQARVEDEALEHRRIREIKRDLEESSKEAGLFLLPPIASILPSWGKGQVGNIATTPGGTSVPDGSSNLRDIPLLGVLLRLRAHLCRVTHSLLWAHLRPGFALPLEAHLETRLWRHVCVGGTSYRERCICA